MQKRRLAAIMFTDIVGYSALMGTDENMAFQLLRKNRDIHRPVIEKYNGEWLKEIGDGILASFDSASDAVRCSCEILYWAKNEGIPLRIGIHEGEVVFEDGDVLGDGVNLASRLQESADEGTVVISGSVYREIKNKKDIQTEFIGEKSFRNIEDPEKVYTVKYEDKSFEGHLAVVPEIKQKSPKPVIAKPYLKISGVLVVIGALIVFFLFTGGKTVPFTERDWIVITDFNNHTDEAILDKSLNTAFSLSINQSRYLNVLSRKRVQEALNRMQYKKREYIDEETGREVAIREGVKLCIAPSISRVGSQYILTAQIQEAKTADILKSEVLYAKSQDDIIRKLDQLSKRIRRSLGESRYKISEHNKPLSKVTTPSLEALEQYSIGVEFHQNSDFRSARKHYENAIRIDSGFTAAKASLGNLLFERFDREEGRKWMEEAIVSIDNLTDREKYAILASYAVNVENDLDKGIEYTKIRTELYPDDPIPHNNLGWYYQNSMRYKEAVEEYKKALLIDPYLMLTYGGLIWLYLENLAQIDSAFVWTNRMIQYGPESPWAYFYLGSCHLWMDDFESAEKAYLEGREINPDLMIVQYRLAHTYRLQGKFDQAIEVLKNILNINPGEVSAYYDLGINYKEKGDLRSAQANFTKFLETAKAWEVEYPDDPATYIVLGTTLTRLGQIEEGWQAGTKALEMDSSIHFRYAEFLAAQDKKEEALDHLEKALEQGYRDLVWIKINPDIGLLHDEPRYRELINTYFMN
jgi:tetratricopeptide (TPR) repeat protein